MAANATRQVHAGKYPCIYCPAHFSIATDRATHMRAAHEIEDGFLCHECNKTFSDRGQYNRHCRAHTDARPLNAHLVFCGHFYCDFRSHAQGVLDRHAREDHLANGAPRAQCLECAYSNDSIVGLSVHNLYVHSKEAMALRKQEEKEIRAAKRAAAREAARAAAVPTAAASAYDASANVYNNTVSKPSPHEMIDLTGDELVVVRPAKRKRAPSSSPVPGSSVVSSPAVQLPTPRPVLSREEQDALDAAAEASNAFLAQQMAARDALPPVEKEQVGLSHRERKKIKEKERKAAARAKKPQ